MCVFLTEYLYVARVWIDYRTTVHYSILHYDWLDTRNSVTLITVATR